MRKFPPEQGRAKSMYELVPEAGTVDLKDLVLQMTVTAEDSGQVLEASLQGLAELFRRNCIRITVERQNR